MYFTEKQNCCAALCCCLCFYPLSGHMTMIDWLVLLRNCRMFSGIREEKMSKKHDYLYMGHCLTSGWQSTLQWEMLCKSILEMVMSWTLSDVFAAWMYRVWGNNYILISDRLVIFSLWSTSRLKLSASKVFYCNCLKRSPQQINV